MRRTNLTALAFVLLVLPPLAWTKGETLSIEIRGDGLVAPIEITDPNVVGLFDVWNGPGVTMNGRTYHLDPDRQQGAFIDWPRGAAVTHPRGLRRIEVTFRVGQPRAIEPRLYVFLYELEAASGRGYIYLPVWTNDLITHGVEGTWFHASARWNEVIGSLIAQQARTVTADASEGALQGALQCTVGTGMMKSDGTIEFYNVYEAGEKRTSWRFTPQDPEYASVRAHLGDIVAEREAPVSCWPPRT